MSEHRPRYTRIKPALLLCDLIISIGYLLPQIRYNQKFSNKDMRRITQYYVDKESRRKTSARNTFFCKIMHIQKGDIQAEVEWHRIVFTGNRGKQAAAWLKGRRHSVGVV